MRATSEMPRLARGAVLLAARMDGRALTTAILGGLALVAVGCSSEGSAEGAMSGGGAEQSPGAAGGDGSSAGSAGQAPSGSAAGAAAAGTGAAMAGNGSAGTESPSPDGGASEPEPAPQADASAGNPEPTEPTEVPDYDQPGPYGVNRLLNQGMGLVSGGSSALLPAGHTNDPSAFTLFLPEGAEPGATFPVLTFGNGTFCSPTFYDEFIGHVVSYGYIVIAPNTSNTGTAVEMLQGVDWVLAQNEEPNSPLHGLVDVEHIGAFGHSQGGAGTCRAGADPRIDAIASLSGTAEIPMIQCPAFFVTTGGEAGTDPDARIEQALSEATEPSMYGITVGGNHDEYTDIADEGITAAIGLTSNDGKQSRAAVTAWFEWQLKGKPEVGALFLEEPCGFCNADDLQRLELDGF